MKTYRCSGRTSQGEFCFEITVADEATREEMMDKIAAILKRDNIRPLEAIIYRPVGRSSWDEWLPGRRHIQSVTGNDMMQQPVQESVSLLQELDLGWHTLFLMSDGSMDLLANDSETPYLAENALHLDSDETYRLFISLYEQLKHPDA